MIGAGPWVGDALGDIGWRCATHQTFSAGGPTIIETHTGPRNAARLFADGAVIEVFNALGVVGTAIVHTISKAIFIGINTNFVGIVAIGIFIAIVRVNTVAQLYAFGEHTDFFTGTVGIFGAGAFGKSFFAKTIFVAKGSF